jgi:uncharacterized protein YkwD
MIFYKTKEYYSNYGLNTFFDLVILHQKITKLFVDIDLLDASIFWVTNVERKKYNLQLFKFHDKLAQTAMLHSNQMKLHDFFSHENSFDTRYKTLTDRINVVNDHSFKGFMCWGENIADIPVIKANENFSIENRNGVLHYFATNGSEILPYSYHEFAKVVVNVWMNSPGHRKNILNPEFKYLGCGNAYYEKKDSGFSMLYFKSTQNFGGELQNKNLGL